MAAWSTDGSENLSRCGHCDNCKRPPESIERKNVVLQAWQIVKVSQIIESEGGRVTLGMLSDLVRGAGGQSFGVGGSRSKEKNSLDLEAVASGKVEMNKDASLHFIEIIHTYEDLTGCGEPFDNPTSLRISQRRI